MAQKRTTVLTLKNDVIFKAVYGRDAEECKTILIALLNRILDLNMLADKRRTGELDFFQINMCVQRDNYKEIADFVRWGNELNVDQIYLTPIRNWGTYSAEEFEDIRIFDDQKKLKPEVKEAIEQIEDRSRVLFAFPV